MQITDFLNSENQKVNHLSGKDKANALLESVINELTTIRNDQKMSSDSPEYFMTMIDFGLELLVTKQFLKYYIDTGNFNLIVMPYPDTKEEKETIEVIKADLQSIFLQ
jgi:hypothetical protein